MQPPRIKLRMTSIAANDPAPATRSKGVKRKRHSGGRSRVKSDDDDDDFMDGSESGADDLEASAAAGKKALKKRRSSNRVVEEPAELADEPNEAVAGGEDVPEGDAVVANGEREELPVEAAAKEGEDLPESAESEKGNDKDDEYRDDEPADDPEDDMEEEGEETPPSESSSSAPARGNDRRRPQRPLGGGGGGRSRNNGSYGRTRDSSFRPLNPGGRVTRSSSRKYDDEGYDDNDEEEDETTKKRLRPRNRIVDYKRQVPPGKGWAGEPFEVFEMTRTQDTPNGKSRGFMSGADDGPGASRYRPGRLSGPPALPGGLRPPKGAGSDDSDERATPRRRTGAGGAGASRGPTIDPINLNELLRQQEMALMKDLPEEERDKMEKEMRMFRSTSSKDLADTDPLAVTVSFDHVGGLTDHIRSLKEMVVMPLLYPEVFSSFKITAPRGVLFYGPPGTGKTLMARALAASCSTTTHKVAFFMRKGADVLSKWVGESERQLRLLFEQAKTYQPSIIFFDEIDGQVVVIGATNRIDAIDPALRRPGRFDRELYFPLPNESARLKILQINTTAWNPPVDEGLVKDLARATQGYCGADVKALCTEAALTAVRRSFPEIYESGKRLKIDLTDVRVTREDFVRSMRGIVPSTERVTNVHAAPIPAHLRPLLQGGLNRSLASLDVLIPMMKRACSARADGLSAGKMVGSLSMLQGSGYVRSLEPRLLICGPKGNGQSVLGQAVVEWLEERKVNVVSLDLAFLMSDTVITMESRIVESLTSVRRKGGIGCVYLPDVNVWWDAVSESCRVGFMAALEGPGEPLLVLMTSEKPWEELQVDPEIRRLVLGKRRAFDEGWKRVVEVSTPNDSERRGFFETLVALVRCPPTRDDGGIEEPEKIVLRELEVADEPPPRKLTEQELDAIVERDEELRTQMRLEFRAIIAELKRKRWTEFSKPVDLDEYPDYYELVTRPMDLSTISFYVNSDQYSVVEEFIEDFESIRQSAEEFNVKDSPIVAKVRLCHHDHYSDGFQAHELLDNFMTCINALRKTSPDFVWELRQAAFRRKLIEQQRKRDGLSPLFAEPKTNGGFSRKDLNEWVRKKMERRKESEGNTVGDPETREGSVGKDAAGADEGAVKIVKKRSHVIEDDDDDPMIVGTDDAAGTSGVLSSAGETKKQVEVATEGTTSVAEKSVVSVTTSTSTSVTTALVDIDHIANCEPVGSATVTSVSSKRLDMSTVMETVATVDGVACWNALKDTLKDKEVAVSVETVISNVATTASVVDVEGSTSISPDNTGPTASVNAKDGPTVTDDPTAHAAIATPPPVRPPTPPPPPEVRLSAGVLEAFESKLLEKTNGRSVADLEGLGVALAGVVERTEQDINRDGMVEVCIVVE
ncbi:ATPase AAA domain-containing protein 2 [Irineochytrium annulatum]|nr:ATPase AAA domain-containing protein 2 [Irineochytrium annulatum]